MSFEDWWAEFSSHDKSWNDAAGNFETAAVCAWDKQQETVDALEAELTALRNEIEEQDKVG